MNMIKKFLIILVLLSILPHSTAIGEFKGSKEYIITFPDSTVAQKFAKETQSPQAGQYVMATLTSNEAQSLMNSYPASLVEENYEKEISFSNTDPISSQQWYLESVGYRTIKEQFAAPSPNHFIGSKISSENQTITYDGGAIPFQLFSLEFNQPIRRISVLVDNPQGEWTLEVMDTEGNLLSTNTTNLKQNDILLGQPKSNGKFLFKVSTKDGWIPTISELFGVNHSVVAVIDTGLSHHEDFCHNVLFSLGKDYVEDDSDPQDENGHGTHVTGILAACANNGKGITGIVGNGPVDVIPFRALNGEGRGTDFNLSRAMKEATRLGVDVVNLSFTGKGKTTMLENSIYEAYQNNILVVAAAGNDSSTTDKIYPASYPGVITVIGTNSNETKHEKSNYGWEAEISAPGTNLISTLPDNKYKEMTGTSMAAPIVSGILALYKHRFNEMDWIQARELIEYTAKDLDTPGYDINTGFGLIHYGKYYREPDRTIEWISLKSGKPLTHSLQTIGLSNKIKGKNVQIYIDEQYYRTASVDSLFLEVELPSRLLDNKEHALLAVATDGDKVIGSHFLQVNSEEKTNNFVDITSDYWAYENIQTTSKNGWINGYTDGSFQPSNSITRRHSLMMLNRMFEWNTPDLLANPFKDVSNFTPGYLSILIGSENGLVKGYPDESFRGENELLRGQMAVILTRLLNGEVPEVQREIHPFQDLKKDTEVYRAVQWLTKKGIFKEQDNFNPYAPMTRAQFATVLVRLSEVFNH